MLGSGGGGGREKRNTSVCFWTITGRDLSHLVRCVESPDDDDDDAYGHPKLYGLKSV